MKRLFCLFGCVVVSLLIGLMIGKCTNQPVGSFSATLPYEYYNEMLLNEEGPIYQNGTICTNFDFDIEIPE